MLFRSRYPLTWWQYQAFLVKRFFIARYPLTWWQYQAFLEDPEGYVDWRWWRGLQREDAPGEQYWPIGNRPAENVSWYDAVAYCRWASARLGHHVRLPGETEWQQAATGGKPANTHPWGPDWRAGCANTWESRLGRSIAVGMYTAGASVHRVHDLAGNVFEWCLNEYDAPRRAKVGGSARRVVRGGSWTSEPDLARCAFRGDNVPGYRHDRLGLRLVCVSPILKR